MFQRTAYRYKDVQEPERDSIVFKFLMTATLFAERIVDVQRTTLQSYSRENAVQSWTR
jgi:hypothetical protein